jgi:peptide/nickel transport system substrate-binding protein
MRVPFRLILGVTILTWTLAACSRAPGPDAVPDKKTAAASAGPPVKGDWVVQVIGADPDTLNPITGQDATGAAIMSPNIFESMLKMNHDTLKLDPWLAQSCEISPDQLTYTFHLRHDIKWQDGVPLTAADVKYSYERVQDPKVDAADKRIYFSTVKSCEVLDPYTIQFKTTERYFKTLEALGTADTLPIVPKHILEKIGGDFNSSPFNRAPVGSGPYKFVRWKTGTEVVLERDDHYWGGPGHYPKRLVYQVIQEPYVAAQLLKKGEIDVVDGMSPLIWERTLAHSRSMNRINRIVYDYPAYSYLGFNLRKPLFTDIRVRHAIDLLVPRKEILAQIYLNQYGTNATGYDPPSSPNYNHAVLPTPYDPVLAAKLLAEAGWSNSAGDGILHRNGQPLSFSILYTSASPSAEKMAELLQESFRRGGIDLQLTRLEYVQMFSRVQDWKFDTAILGWALDVNGDPSQLWDGSQANIKKSSNFIGYSDPEADKLIAAGRLEYDNAKRAVIYRQLQKIIHDDYPVCFLFNPRVIMLVSNRFQNVHMFVPRPCFDISTWWVPTAQEKYH